MELDFPGVSTHQETSGCVDYSCEERTWATGLEFLGVTVVVSLRTWRWVLLLAGKRLQCMGDVVGNARKAVILGGCYYPCYLWSLKGLLPPQLCDPELVTNSLPICFPGVNEAAAPCLIVLSENGE